MKKKYISCCIALLLAFLFALVPISAQEAELPSTEEILSWEGLSVRLHGNNSGIRSVYRANHDAIALYEAEGYTIAYGAVIGIGERDGVSYTTAQSLTVSGNSQNGYTSQGKGTAAITVYVTNGASYASGVYTDKEIGEYAYTVVFDDANEKRSMYLDCGFVFAGFVALTAPDGTQTIRYVHDAGSLFGGETAAYGASTSLAEIADYFVNRFQGDAELRHEYNANQRLRTILSRSGIAIRTDISENSEEQLERLLAENASVTNLLDGWMFNGTLRPYGQISSKIVETGDEFVRGVEYSTVGYSVPSTIPGGAVMTMSDKLFVSKKGHVGLLKITAKATHVPEGENAKFLAVLKNQNGANTLRQELTVGTEYTTFYIPVTSADLINRFNAQMGYDMGQSATSSGGQSILFTEIAFYDFGESFDIEKLPSGITYPTAEEGYRAADDYFCNSIYGEKALASSSLYLMKSNVSAVSVKTVNPDDGIFASGLSISTKGLAPTTSNTQGTTHSFSTPISLSGSKGVLKATVKAPYSAEGNAKFRLRLVGASAFFYEECEIPADGKYYTLYFTIDLANTITKINIFVGNYNQAPSADGTTIGGQELVFTEFELLDLGNKSADGFPSGCYPYASVSTKIFEDGEENEGANTVLSDAAFAGQAVLTEGIDMTRDTSLPYGENIYTVYVDRAAAVTETAMSYKLSDSRKAKFETGDLLLLTFYARSLQGTGKVTPMILNSAGSNILTYTATGGNVPMSYYVPAQWSKIVLPIVAPADFSELSLCFGDNVQQTEIAGISVEKADGTIDDIARFTGIFCMEETFEQEVKEIQAHTNILAAALDIVTTDRYLYAIGKGSLVIADIAGKNATSPEFLGSVKGLGNVRQLAVSEELGIALITGRPDGIYVINIKDPTSPTLSSYYNSIEMATGISMTGSYAFVANRSFGVEIVDFSDPENPRHVANVRCDGEAAQSCEVVDGVMYAGIWAAQKVMMYDVSDPKNPQYLGEAPLNGRGDGFTVHKDKNGRVLLYAATGQHSYNVSTTTPLTDPRYGQGNGMEIFDVTDPTSPVFLSCVKTDGRFFWSGNDFWEVTYTEDDNGGVYAYLVSTYNGVFVFNVSDPTAPQRLGHFYITIPPSSSNFVRVYKASNGTAAVFPFDYANAEADKWDPVGAISIKNGVLYMAGVTTGVYAVSLRDGSLNEVKDHTDASLTESTTGMYDNVGAEYTRIELQGQVQSVFEYGDYYYVSCGDGGIAILNKQLQVVAVYQTNDAVQYLEIVNGILYSAQSHDGLCFYRVNGAVLTPVGRAYVPDKYSNDVSSTVRMVRVTPDGKYTILQIGSSTVRILDVSNLSSPKELLATKSSGQMYFRNLCIDLVSDRYLCAYGSGSQYFVFDLYYPVGDGTTTVKLIKTYSSNNVNYNGLVAYGDLILSPYASGRYAGYFLYDPLTATAVPASASELYCSISGFGSGKPTIFTYEGETYLFVSERVKGNIYILNISDIKKPRLLYSDVLAGNPDLITLGEDGTILIPAAFGGLLTLSLDDIIV